MGLTEEIASAKLMTNRELFELFINLSVEDPDVWDELEWDLYEAIDKEVKARLEPWFKLDEAVIS